MKKHVKAFTLIELIVVIAIIGVLAAILIPSLISYLGDSKLSTANSNAKLVYNCSTMFAASSSANGYTVTPDSSLSGVAIKLPDDVVTSYKNDGSKTEHLKAIIYQLGNQSDASGVISVFIITDSYVDRTLWAKRKNDRYLGSYPELTSDPVENPESMW